MANKKQHSKYTIVYVFGPSRCKDVYLDNKMLNRDNGEFVKIGKTDYAGDLNNCTEESIKLIAIERCKSETRTGISDWCDIYDTFIFPQKEGQNVDDIIRNLLCNDVYSLANSKDEIKEKKGDISPGREYVYGVSRNHIKHAVESYCFQLIINASVEDLEDIQTICKYNNNITDDLDDENEEEPTRTRKVKDITMVLSPGDIVYLINPRNKNIPVLKDGKQIYAEYIGGKKFRFENRQEESASKLALDLISEFALNGETYETINGNKCWMKETTEDGKRKMISLSDLYDLMVSSVINS